MIEDNKILQKEYQNVLKRLKLFDKKETVELNFPISIQESNNRTRSDFAQRCRNLSIKLSYHICYICCCEFLLSKYITHWVSEIKAFIKNLYDYKIDSSKQDVFLVNTFDYVFGSSYENIYKVFENAIRKEIEDGKKARNDDYKILEKDVLPYINSFADSNRNRIKNFYIRTSEFMDRYKHKDDNINQDIINLIRNELVEYYVYG